MRKLSWRNGPWDLPVPFSIRLLTLWSFRFRYNDDISLEDAIHTALLTLKEGFEGQMTEKTIEIGIITVPTAAEIEAGMMVGPNTRPKPTFRKLAEEEVKDYLSL
jgi:20S proteasome subunit alpha 2